MCWCFRGERLPRYVIELINCALAVLVFLSIFVLCYLSGLWKKSDAWLKYHEANMDASTLRSTMCRIEGVITEEIRPNKSETVHKTLIQSYFLLKVINSTNKHDQFRTSEVSLLHEPGQKSLVSLIKIVTYFDLMMFLP